MRLVWICAALSLLTVVVGFQTVAAQGQEVPQRTDPGASSPAGVVYQIPLDSGRRDAAPVLPIGSRGSNRGETAGARGATNANAPGATPRTPASAGKSSPAATRPGSSTGGRSTLLAASGSPAATGNASSIHSENGFGSASRVPGVGPTVAYTGAGVATAGAAGSALPTYLLIGLVVLAALAAGIFATGTRRHNSREDWPQPPGS